MCCHTLDSPPCWAYANTMTRYDKLQVALTEALAMRDRAEAMGAMGAASYHEHRIASLTRALVHIAEKNV